MSALLEWVCEGEVESLRLVCGGEQQKGSPGKIEEKQRSTDAWATGQEHNGPQRKSGTNRNG